jgi:hypothetical protein
MFLLMMLSVVITEVNARTWLNLQESKSYQLTQNIALPQSERSGSLLNFSQNDVFSLKALERSSDNLLVYTFEQQICSGSQMRTSLEIIPVQETSPMIEIGAQFIEDCELKIFISDQDLHSTSIFK